MAEIDIFETLSKYSISINDIQMPEKRQEAIDRLVVLYKDLLSHVKARSAEETKKVTESLKDDVMAQPHLKMIAGECNARLYTMLANIVESDPKAIIVFVDYVRAWSKAVTTEHAYVLEEMLKDIRPGLTTPMGTDSLQDITNLQKAIRAVLGFGGKLPDDFWIKNKAPQVSEDGQPTSKGRGAIYRRLRFMWNGEMLPNGTSPNDVIHNYVNDIKKGYVLSWRNDVLPRLNKDNVKLSSTRWTLQFDTGVLEGWPEPSDDTSDDDVIDDDTEDIEMTEDTTNETESA